MISVMSFNLRYGTAKDGENSWENRKGVQAEMLRRYHPDLIGTQEGLKFQLDFIVGEFPEYEFFGVSRLGSDEDEFAAIIYDSRRLKLIDGGNFWLSETPHLPGSRSWDSSLPRMVTWALLETIDGGRFYHFNTHLDHRSEEARRRGAMLIWREIRSKGDLPVILTGDFNTTPDSWTWRFLTGRIEGDERGDLHDAWLVAKENVSDVRITYHGFKGRDAEAELEGETGRRVIDWILVRGFEVDRFEIVTFSVDGRYPSDHYPVYAELHLPLFD